MKSPSSAAFAAGIFLTLMAGTVRAQTSVLADGLDAPTKVVLLHGGDLLVSEQGAFPAAPPDPYPFVANAGRITRIGRHGGRLALLEHLPSGLDLDGVSPSGPTGLLPAGRHTLYFEIGQGDSIRRVMGSEVPNPEGPSAALLSSVWYARFNKPIDELNGGFVLDPAHDYPVLADGRTLRLVNEFGERVWLTVLADLRDLYPADPPNAVTGSNPFGLVRLGPYLYLPDAGQNSLVRIGLLTGRIHTVAHFPPVPNTVPFGPPVSQAVPNGISALPGTPAVLVTLFSGFPFGQGASRIERVNLFTGEAEPFISGLTLAIDVLPLGHREGGFLVLEYAAGFGPLPPPPAPAFVAPGRLLRFSRAGAAPIEVSRELITPTSMAWDRRTREVFVTEISTGRIVRVTLGSPEVHRGRRR